jgi:hypothetical protein
MTCRRLGSSCCNWFSHRSDSAAGSEACRRGLRREFHHIHFPALDYSCKQVSSLRFPRICDVVRADLRCFRGFSDVVRLLIRNSADVNHFVSSCDTNLIMQVLLLLFISVQSPKQTLHSFSAVPAMRPHISCIILQPSFLPNLLESPYHSVRTFPRRKQQLQTEHRPIQVVIQQQQQHAGRQQCTACASLPLLQELQHARQQHRRPRRPYRAARLGAKGERNVPQGLL